MRTKIVYPLEPTKISVVSVVPKYGKLKLPTDSLLSSESDKDADETELSHILSSKPSCVHTSYVLNITESLVTVGVKTMRPPWLKMTELASSGNC